MSFHLTLLIYSDFTAPGDKLSGKKFLPPQAPCRELKQLPKKDLFLLFYFTSISINSMYRPYFLKMS